MRIASKRFKDEVGRKYTEATGLTADFYVCTIGNGVERLSYKQMIDYEGGEIQMAVLVTGGAGYIGSHAVAALAGTR